MKTATQKARSRQAVNNYAEKYGVTKEANRYDITRQYTIDGRKERRNSPFDYINSFLVNGKFFNSFL